MDESSKKVLELAGIYFDNISQIEGQFIPREQFLSDNKYEEIKKLIPELKTKYSSSFMTSLQQNAEKAQRWPLLNIVRQILSKYNYKMRPIRKSDGYTLDGIKKYKRFFQIERKTVIESNEETKQEHVEEKLSEDVLV
jgi:signal recognition particle subunit SEC65